VLLHNTLVLCDRYGLRVRFLNLCAVMKLRIKKKSSRTFVIPAHTSLRSPVPAFMSPTRGISQSCEYAAHASKNASHIATLALDVPFPCSWFFFVSCLKDAGKPSSRDRVINAPCDPSAPRFLAARAGLHFVGFLRVLLRVDFSPFFGLSNNFFAIYIIIDTSLTSSHH
jgi:hypothetical protein